MLSSRSHFSNQLSSAIQFCGLSPSVYKGHSFRIGAASHAADKGLSDAQIRLLRRWKSNAFLISIFERLVFALKAVIF